MLAVADIPEPRNRQRIDVFCKADDVDLHRAKHGVILAATREHEAREHEGSRRSHGRSITPSMLWMVLAAALPSEGVELRPFEARSTVGPARTVVYELRLRRPAPRPSEVTVKIRADVPGQVVKHLPWTELQERVLRFAVQVPPAHALPAREDRLGLVIDLVRDGRVRRRLRVRQRFVIEGSEGPDVGIFLALPDDAHPLLRLAARPALQSFVREANDPRVPSAVEALGEQARAPAFETVVEGLTIAQGLLEEVDIPSAEAALNRVVRSLGPSRAELARALQMKASVALLQRRESRARQLYLQATSLAPKLPSTSPFPWTQAYFEAELTGADRALDIEDIRFEEVEAGLDASVGFGPDPGRLGVKLALQLPQLGIDRVLDVAHVQDAGRATLIVPLDHVEVEQLTAKIRLMDTYENALSERGFDRPLYVPVERIERTRKVPTWVWIVAGAAALGAATASVIVVTSAESVPNPPRNIGPIDVRF